jgi:hypothetical protein
MSLSDWQKNAWVKPHASSSDETKQLLDVVARDLRVSGNAEMDPDWRFIAAYNAALQSATVALHASGFEATKGGGAHFYTIESLKFTVGDDGDLVDLLQAFKSKRGGAVYEKIGIASETEIAELRDLAERLRDRVVAWLKTDYPRLLEAPRGTSRRDKPKK